MVPNKSEIIHTIKTKEELKNKLGLGVNINIPEFKQTLEFTQSELDELKDSIVKKPENEIFAILEEKIKEKTSLTIKAQGEAVTDKAGLKIDILKGSLDKAKNPSFDYGESLKTLDLTKNLESQKNLIESIGAGVIILIPELSKFNLIEKGGFASMEDLAKINNTEAKNKLSPTSYNLLNKLIEISTGNGEVSEYFKSNWQNLQSRGLEVSATATSFIDKLDKKDYKLDKKESEGVLGWMKENPGKSAIGLALGAFVGYKAISFIGGGLFGGGDSKNGEKDGVTDGIFDKMGLGKYGGFLKKFGILGILAAVAIGAFMGKDKLGAFWENIKDFLSIESKEEKEAFTKFAEKISGSDDKVKIRPETIHKIKGDTVNDFINPVNSFITKGRSYISGLAGKGAEMLGQGDVAKYMGLGEKDLSEMEAIQKYLEKRIKSGELKVNDKTTIGDLAKLESGNQELVKSVDSSHIPEIGVGAGMVAGTEGGNSDNKEVNTGNPGIILGARSYQAWYGVVKPIKDMDGFEKSYITGKIQSVLNIFRKDENLKNFDLAKKELPKFQSEYLKLEDKISLGTITDEEKIKMTMLDTRIKALEGGSESYRKFVLLVEKTPEDFIKHIESIELKRVSNKETIIFLKERMNASDVEDFKRISKDVSKVMDDQSLIVNGLNEELSALEKQKIGINMAEPGAAEKIANIESQILEKQKNIGKIEGDVKHLFEQFKTQNEKYLIGVMKNQGKLSLWGKTKDFFGYEVNIENLKINPDKKIFRFGSYKGALVLTGIGVGISAFTSKKANGDVNWDQVGHTAKRVGAGFIPVYGTYLDAKDAFVSLGQGDMLGLAANTGACVASAAGDILLGISLMGGVTAGIGVEAKIGTSALRTAIKEFFLASKSARLLKGVAVGGAAVAIGASLTPLVSYALNGDKLEKVV